MNYLITALGAAIGIPAFGWLVGNSFDATDFHFIAGFCGASFTYWLDDWWSRRAASRGGK